MASKLHYQPLLFDSYRYMKKKTPESTYGNYGYNWAKKIDTTKMNRFNKKATNIHENLKLPNNNRSESNLNNTEYQHYYTPQHTLKVTFHPNVLENSVNNQGALDSISHDLPRADNVQPDASEDGPLDLSIVAKRCFSAPITDKKLHWIAYPQEQTPQRILDAKKRLNQVHPRTPPVIKQKVAQKDHDEQVAILKQYIYANDNGSNQTEAPTMRHWFYHEQQRTPESIQDARIKQGDQRYNGGWVKENKKQQAESEATTDNVPVEVNERASSAVKNFAYNHFQRKTNEASSNNVHGYEAHQEDVPIANGQLTINDYADMSFPQVDSNDTSSYYQHASLDNYAVGAYPVAVQNHSDKNMIVYELFQEKQSVMNMLRSIDNGRKSPTRQTYGIRTRPPSSMRKLGRTRQVHKLPCSSCERMLVKQHIVQMRKCPECISNTQAIKNEEDYHDSVVNLTSHFTNSMPNWRGQYVVYPEFRSEGDDLKRLYPNMSVKRPTIY